MTRGWEGVDGGGGWGGGGGCCIYDIYRTTPEDTNHGFSVAFDQDEVFTGIGPWGEGRAPPTIT